MIDKVPDPYVRTLRIQVSCIPTESHWGVFVDFRGHRDGIDWYSVTDGFKPPDTLDRKGKWSQESRPSMYSTSWRKARQFELDEAIEIAKKYAPEVKINGFTVADGIRMRALRENQRA